MVFYEAPHRALETLEGMADALGAGREATYVRELTKVFETVRRDTLGRLVEWVREDPDQRRGEIVIVVRGSDRDTAAEPDTEQARQTLEVLLQELPLKQAVSLAVKLTGMPRNRLYREAVALKRTED